MYPVLVLFAQGMVLLGCAGSGWMSALCTIFVGFGFVMLIPTIQLITVNFAPPTRINSAAAAVYFFLDAGTGLAPLLLGLLIPVTGYGQVSESARRAGHRGVAVFPGAR